MRNRNYGDISPIIIINLKGYLSKYTKNMENMPSLINSSHSEVLWLSGANLSLNTSEHYPQAGIPRIHNLIEGIYKLAGDQYAFSIWSRSAVGQDREIYHDVFDIDSEGSWTINYAAKKGSLDSAVNR